MGQNVGQTMERPPKWDTWQPPEDRLPDEAWEAVPDSDWTTDPAVVSEKRCRRLESGEACRRPAVAAFDRSHSWSARRPNWWAYCERHMYNRWIEDDKVLIWRVKPEWRERA